MSGKVRHRKSIIPYDAQMTQGLRCLQHTIQVQQKLTSRQNCPCSLCKQQFGQDTGKIFIRQNFQQQTGKTYLKLLNGLCVSGVPGLKLFFPDLCFVDGDMLSVFSTEHRQNRFVKLSGTIPAKSIFPTLLRLKSNYKGVLQENFQKNLLDKIDPKYMHEKYMNQLLPTHFHDGFDSEKLRENKNKFKDYILHKNINYTIPGIEQHKLNDNEHFCIVNYNDGNSQLYTQREFETLVVLKIPHDAVYVQSYIKEKKEVKNIYTSEYRQFSPDLDFRLFDLAQVQVMVLIGGMDKYNDRYKDLQELEDNAIQLMKLYPQQYALYSTYRIIHYLAMVARIYVSHLKINWVLNDIGNLYVQNIFQIETTEISERHIKFRLPPKAQNLNFYKDSERFINLYHEMQIHCEAKRRRIREELILEEKNKEKMERYTTKGSIAQLISEGSTVDRTTDYQKRKRLKPLNTLAQTFQIDKDVHKRRKSENKNNRSKGKISTIAITRQPRYQSFMMGNSMPLKKKKHLRFTSVVDKYHF